MPEAKFQYLNYNKRTWSSILTTIVLALTIFVALNLLYSAFCAFTWGKFEMMDYGVYTNMLWNSAHGNLFKHHMNLSYLYTHLSFSLLFLAPLFLVWDSPMLLLFVQWGMVLGGAVILWKTLRMQKVPSEMIAALVFLLVGYRFTQSALMSEFHGIAVYYLLVPWLYRAMLLRQRTAWLALILILGVREDAFIFLLPMLMYFAIKHKAWENYCMLGATVCYGLLAVFVLYPEINGITVFHRRSVELNFEKSMVISWDNYWFRLHAIILTYLPALVFSGRKGFPAFWFPLAALAAALCSALSGEQSLGSHHPPPVITMMVMGLAETTILRLKSAGVKNGITVRAVLLVLLIIAVHFYSGFLFMGGKSDRIFRTLCFRGAAAMSAAQNIPVDGRLATDKNLAVYCANRENIITWKRFDSRKHSYDLVFGSIDHLGRMDDGRVLEGIMSGALGVRFFDNFYFVLEAGYDVSANTHLLHAFHYGPVPVPYTLKHAGEDPFVSGSDRRTRFWAGEGHRAPVTLSYGGCRELTPGSYKAVFSYRARKPRKVHSGSWGLVSVHYLNDQGVPLAKEEIAHVESVDHAFLSQDVLFSINRVADIEFRITGGDAELWLDSVTFVPVEKDGVIP